MYRRRQRARPHDHRGLVAEGARTYILGRTADTLAATAAALMAAGGECIPLPGDLATRAGVRAAAAAFAAREQRLDLLVNNAGTMYDSPVEASRRCYRSFAPPPRRRATPRW